MFSSRPVISVIMPVYNGERTLRRALDSLFMQTFHEWEAVIVNDGSTDGTVSFLSGVKDRRLRVIHHGVNKGRAAARQTGLDATRGEFITYLDCDDFYHPCKLQSQLAVFLRHAEVDYCSCGLGSFSPDGQLRRVRACFTIDRQKFESGEKMRLSPGASMIRSSVAKKCSYNLELNLGEDTDYFQRALNKRLYSAIPDVLYFYGEYESVTKKKILSSYIASLQGARSYWAIDKKRAFELGLHNLGKAGLLVIAYPFLSDYWILDRRGSSPALKDLKEFKAIYEAIGL